MAEGNGRLDLMPIESLCKLFNDNDKILDCFKAYHETNNPIWFLNAIGAFLENGKYWENYPDDKPGTRGFYPPMILDVAIHYEQGALKYGENNWQKGIPISSYIDSAMRHYFKHCCGMTDEHHNRVFVWNMLCAYWEATVISRINKELL